MAKVTIKAPVTVHYEGRYVAPGTEIELEEDEAKRLIGTHGEYGVGVLGDPANTQIINVLDENSVEELNKQASINKGHGEGKSVASGAHRSQTQSALPSDEELEAMNKPELVALAGKRAVAIEHNDTKAEIIDKMKAAGK